MKSKVTASLLIVMILMISSCKKVVPPTIPEVTTNPVKNITSSTAISGGNVTSDGGREIIARGVCWGISTNPTISDSKSFDKSGTGYFTSSLTGLHAVTTYHIRAYATNMIGTAYGNDLSFTTPGQDASSFTLEATNIPSSGATLNGTVNPNTLSATMTFENGLSTGYELIVTAVEGTDDFRPAPLVPNGSSQLLEYAGSCYYRGHLCPAQDMSYSEAGLIENEDYIILHTFGKYSGRSRTQIDYRIPLYIAKELPTCQVLLTCRNKTT